MLATGDGAGGAMMAVERSPGRFSGFGSDGVGVGQMMPLLIAVAIAIALLEAENFWIAWVM